MLAQGNAASQSVLRAVHVHHSLRNFPQVSVGSGRPRTAAIGTCRGCSDTRLAPQNCHRHDATENAACSRSAAGWPHPEYIEAVDEPSSANCVPHIFSAVAIVVASSVVPLPAAAAVLHAEPANALSLPTWAIHVSSVVEWVAAMALVWRYADVSGNERWKGLTWGMMPLFGGALCACTHHIFYNDPQLDILVALQAFLTCVGNGTCWWAAARIYKGAKDSTREV